MRPLLWKEMRDLRWWVAGAAAGLCAIDVLAHLQSYRSGFGDAYLMGYMPLLLAAVCIGVGAGQIARERSSRSLEYLLVRPVPAGAIVWSKFLAGSVALMLLMAGIIGLGVLLPQPAMTLSGMVREHLGFRALALVLMPRYWAIYALALFFSVLVDRMAKAAAMMAVIAIATVALAGSMTTLAPFSGFVQWLPYIEGAGGLVVASQSTGLLLLTGSVAAASAFVLAAAAASLLKRSPERYLGSPACAALAAGIVGAAVLSAHGAAVRFVKVAPIGTWQFHAEAANNVSVISSGDRCAIMLDGGVRFCDFSNPGQPTEPAAVELPLVEVGRDWSGSKATMAGDTVSLVGQKKSVPVDMSELVLLKPGSPPVEIVLGPVRPRDFVSRPVQVGRLVYVAFNRDRQCTLSAFDPISKRQVVSLPIDRIEPPAGATNDGEPFVMLTRRGAYLYVTTPSHLTTVDLTDAQHPAVTSQLTHSSKSAHLYGFPRPLAWQGDRLFEAEFWPYSLRPFDLTDPARPAVMPDLVWNDSLQIHGGGNSLYGLWQDGILEFRADGRELRGKRLLSGGERITSLSIGGRYIFGLTDPDDRQARRLQVFAQ